MSTSPHALSSLIRDHRRVRPGFGAHTPFVTGFHPLDEALGGGLHPHDLTLVGGKPGVGKTILGLQWARNMVLDGATAVFACYEHSPQHLLARLLLMELGSLTKVEGLHQSEELRTAVLEFARGQRGLHDLHDERGLLQVAVDCVDAYADRLWLLPASTGHTDLAELTRIVEEQDGPRSVLFVDYLQKVAMSPKPELESEKVRRVAEGLKDMALTRGCAVVAITASTDDGLTAHRQRLHHLRGGAALAYEADLVITLNDKVDAISKIHLAYDGVRAESHRHQVVFSVEKNRWGNAGLDMEFRKDFLHARFDSSGHWVSERLVDERMMAE